MPDTNTERPQLTQKQALQVIADLPGIRIAQLWKCEDFEDFKMRARGAAGAGPEYEIRRGVRWRCLIVTHDSHPGRAESKGRGCGDSEGDDPLTVCRESLERAGVPVPFEFGGVPAPKRRARVR